MPCEFLDFLPKFGELYHQEFCKLLAINLRLRQSFSEYAVR
jgi:hypothetical protein